jgi:hypothetical protein
VLQSQEVRQPRRPDALGAGGLQQHPVHPAEPGRVIAQHGPARASHRAPWDRDPSRFAILASTLDGGRENNLASDGTGSGA